MKKFKTGVFARNNLSIISERSFMGSIAGFIGYGLIVTYIMAAFFAPTIPSLGFLIGVGLVLPLIGCFVAMSDNLPISFIGYNMIVLPIGL